MDDLTLQRRSPLADLADRMRDGAVTGSRHVRLAELPFWTMISVRVDPGSPAAAAVEGVLGADLPRWCGQVTAHGLDHVLWLGPDEWLIVSEVAPSDLHGALTDAVGEAHAAVVDVSANRTLLELSGPGARSVLEKGCPVDLHPRAFEVGRAVSTTLARVPLLLCQTGPDTYCLLPRSSFAQYVACWLLDAMQELGSDFQDGSAS
ncbi:sarcosine oxidase subunit gamma [Isoptericola croceus]|uniref:sarcosine oxidase subunit gamma n=1 Tax=Isoptericola croceus TaxID=3031406 RepID=UPI0023F9A7D3|nr:sarcosine oxidase subunit gamma family protein [Isoptericola croceus]